MAIDLLHEQLSLYQRQCGDLNDRHLAAGSRELAFQFADAIRLGIAVLHGLEARNSRWSSDIVAGATPFRWDEAASLARAFRQWQAFSLPLISALDHCSQPVEGAEEFHRRYHEVGTMSLDVERVRDSLESFSAGRGLSHAEAMNELRARVRQPRA